MEGSPHGRSQLAEGESERCHERRQREEGTMEETVKGDTRQASSESTKSETAGGPSQPGKISGFPADRLEDSVRLAFLWQQLRVRRERLRGDLRQMQRVLRGTAKRWRRQNLMDASQMDASQCQWKSVVGTKPIKMIYQVPPPSKKNCLWVGGGKAPCRERKRRMIFLYDM